MKRREIGGAKEIIMIIYVLLVFALVVGITTALAQFKKDASLKGKQAEMSEGVTGKDTVSIVRYLFAGSIAAIIWLFLICAVAYVSHKTDDDLIYLIFAFFGWRALNKIQPAMFVWIPLIGWVIYFCVKFILSAIVGVFVTPVVIFKFLLYLTKQMVG